MLRWFHLRKLRSQLPLVRAAGVRGLARYRDSDTLSIILPYVADISEAVRQEAVRTATTIDPQWSASDEWSHRLHRLVSTVPELSWRDRAERATWDSIRSALQFGGVKTVSLLQILLRRQEKDESIEYDCCRLLIESNTHEAIEALTTSSAFRPAAEDLVLEYLAKAAPARAADRLADGFSACKKNWPTQDPQKIHDRLMRLKVWNPTLLVLRQRPDLMQAMLDYLPSADSADRKWIVSSVKEASPEWIDQSFGHAAIPWIVTASLDGDQEAAALLAEAPESWPSFEESAAIVPLLIGRLDPLLQSDTSATLLRLDPEILTRGVCRALLNTSLWPNDEPAHSDVLRTVSLLLGRADQNWRQSKYLSLLGAEVGAGLTESEWMPTVWHLASLVQPFGLRRAITDLIRLTQDSRWSACAVSSLRQVLSHDPALVADSELAALALVTSVRVAYSTWRGEELDYHDEEVDTADLAQLAAVELQTRGCTNPAT